MRSESEAGPVGVARCAASHFACTFMTLDMDGAVSGFIGRRRAGGARGKRGGIQRGRSVVSLGADALAAHEGRGGGSMDVGRSLYAI